MVAACAAEHATMWVLGLRGRFRGSGSVILGFRAYGDCYL